MNDGSSDRTLIAAQEGGADLIVSHKRNLGLGATFRDGISEALTHHADIIVNIDADGQYNGAQIPDLIQPIIEEKADIVIGDRQIRKLDHMPAKNLVGNIIATRVTRMATGWNIADAQTGFRAFSREAALRMNISGGKTYVQETLIQAANSGLTLVEIPVEFRKREGESRLIRSLPGYAYSAGTTIFRNYRDYHPLMVFSVIGLVVVLAGVVIGSGVLFHFLATGMVTPYLPSAVLTTVLIIVGLQIFVFGFLADMLKGQRKLMEEILYRLKR